MPRKKASQILSEITKKNSMFMKRFGSITKFELVKGHEILERMGVAVNDYEIVYNYSLRNICEKAGFIIEPAYPVDYYLGIAYFRKYYILKSPFEKAKTRNTILLHLLMKSFVSTFLKSSRCSNKLKEFVEEMDNQFKVNDVDKYRLIEYGKIVLNSKEVRLGTFYSIVKRNLTNKKIRNKLPIVFINVLKNIDGCVDFKEFKNIVKLLERLELDESINILNELDFTIKVKEKMFIFKGKTFKDYSLIPYNHFLDKSGGLKLNLKSIAELRVTTKKAQKLLGEILKIEEVEVPKSVNLKNKNVEKDILLSSCLKKLITKDTWSHLELDEISKKMGVMSMKLIIRVNEYCDDTYGDFLLIEDGKDYFINKHVAGKIYVSDKNKAKRT